MVRATHAHRTGASTRAGKAVRGALIGSVVDNFDIYLPLVALAPAIGFFIPPTLDAQSAALIASWIFVASMVARPLGAFIFGTLSDAIGRRRSTLIAVASFGITTLLMALLPGYGTLGMGAVVLLIALRFVGGIALGGEYSGANVLAMEESPKHRRGLFGGIIQTGGSVAYVALAAFTLVLLEVMPSTGGHSAYAVWGWRIPFILGAAFAFAFLVYYRREVDESKLWTKIAGPKLSVFSLVHGEQRRNFLQVFVLMTGMWFSLNSVTALMAPVLNKGLHLSSSRTTAVIMTLFVVLTVVYVLGGALSQRIGRRRYMIGSAVVAAVIGIPTYAMLIDLHAPSVWKVLIPAVVAGSAVLAPVAVITAYLAERFTTANRGVGYGLGYTLAIIIPSFYATYQIWLAHLIPQRYTVLVLAALGALLIIVGAAVGPETKDIDFHPAGAGMPPVTPATTTSLSI